jgi:hypothetical protein
MSINSSINSSTVSSTTSYKDSFMQDSMLMICYKLYKRLHVVCTEPQKELNCLRGFEFSMKDNNIKDNNIKYIDIIDIKFRVAKVTPVKVGYFVTLWKYKDGHTTPYDFDDSFDLYIICIEDGDLLGQFVFSREVLSHQGIISKHQRGGKRGFRLYAPWNIADSKQAIKTQEWQSNYFINLTNRKSIDLDRARRLYNLS